MDIEQIIDKYNGRIKTVINKFIASPDEAEDVAQEVYLKTWRNLHKYDSNYNIWGWLNSITANICKDYLRKNRKHQVVDGDEEKLKLISDNKERVENKLIMSEREKLILSKINLLKPKLKEVLILFDIEELSYEEIAQKLKCPIGTIKSRLFNARKILKEELADLLT